MKVFDLPLKGEWYDMIASGEKRKRYKGWHRVTKEQGIAEVMAILKGGKK